MKVSMDSLNEHYIKTLESTIVEQNRIIESLEMQNTALRGVFSREEELQATIADMEAKGNMLTDFARNIANEVYPYPEQAVRRASEVLDAIRAKSPESDIDQATRTT